MVVHDFSTGKHKAGSQREQRVLVLLALFAAGLCVGVLVSRQMHVAGAGQLSNGAHSSRTSLMIAGSGAAAAAPLAVGPDTPQSRALRSYLQQVAPQREVLVAVSNVHLLRDGTLDTFLRGVTQAGVANYVVVALDAETHANLKARGLHSFHMPVPIPSSQKNAGENHAVSALKFGIIKQFLQLSWAVLLSDIDVAVLQNPFSHLYRDHDLEGMTDGFDAPTAYGGIQGFDDESMGWARAAQQSAHFNLNSGLFYVAANARTIELMARLEERLARQDYWDQTAFNEEIFFLSHDNYTSPKVTVRVMSIYTFMNSKVLFKDVRHRADFAAMPMPVMVHINYHPDKHERMQAVFKYYLEKDAAALAPFPGGSKPGT